MTDGAVAEGPSHERTADETRAAGLRGDSPVPLYYQLGTLLRSRILTGRYEPGTKLGTEHELCDAFGVSRVTVRQALQLLEDEELIDRRRGQGTFVAETVETVAPVELHGFLDDLILHADYAGTVEVSRDEIAATPTVAAALKIPPNEPVIRFQRLRVRKDAPHAWVVNYVPVDIGQRLDPQDLKSRSLLQLVDELPGCRLWTGYQAIAAEIADTELAGILDVAEGDPVLAIERTVRTEDGRVVELVRAHYRGDRHRFAVHLSRLGH